MKANDIGFTQVDTLGMLLAQIAELTKQADAIKDSIKDSDHQYFFSRFLVGINNLTLDVASKLPKTDCRFRTDL